MNEIKMVSGIGQFHTNEPDKAKRTPYLTIGYSDIVALVDKPQQVDKSQAQWLIPSSYQSRNFKEQEQHGRYFCLWADLDQRPFTLSVLETILKDIIPSDYEIYNTSSANVDNQKARILIPLTEPLNFADWSMSQQVLNNELERLKVIPDRANERAAQLCYLPNRGKFYGSRSQRDGYFFNPLVAWSNEITVKRDELATQQAEISKAKQLATEKRAALKLSDAPNLIAAFNLAYTPDEFLLAAGYAQKGNGFRHINSETGNYSASLLNGRVNTLSSNDPLFSNGQGAHDAFSCFTVLVHGDDKDAALRDAGDNLLTIGDVSFNKALQREHMQKKAAQQKQAPNPPQAQAAFINDNVDYESIPDYGEPRPATKQDTEKPKTPFSMRDFSLKGQSEAMKTKMLADRYVLDRIAILGQATTIYAKPNTGKTLLVLYMLIESIKAGRVNGEDVFYINADDDYKGLVYKTSLAEKYGFHMLAPGHNGFESVALQGYMRLMIDEGTASGTVIILDTLKKFTDLMNKKLGSEFMNRAREYISNGGSLVMLAHTNKNRDADGKAVFSGTSDIVDDCDCVFILDEVAKTQTTKQVLFENIKCRGDIASELAFSYSVEEGKHYQYRLDSIELADKSATEQAKKEKVIADARAKDKEVIDAITEAIDQGISLKSELIVAAHDCSGISKRRLTTVLNKYLGTNINDGDLWREEIGAKNAKSYRLLSIIQSSKEDYSFYKNGE